MFLYRGAESMGIEYLSAFLKKEGHATDLIFDPGFDDTFYFSFPFLKQLNRWPYLIKRVKCFKPDILAVSSITNTYPYIRELIKKIKESYNCYTVIGGVHASIIPEYIIREGLFDAVCIGEGEEALIELVRYLKEGEKPTSLRNFYFIREGSIIKNSLRPLIKNLDTLPFPDKDLFYKYGAFSRSLMVSTSRGCLHSCTYCINEQWKKMYLNLGPGIRRQTPERTIEELKYFTNLYSIKTINFQDDILTIDKNWLERFGELYRRFINLPFQCNVHPRFVSSDIVKLLKEMGCASVCMGIQTAVQKKRKDILGRTETNEQIISAVNSLRKYCLPSYVEYIFGLPGETADDIKENIMFNHNLKPTNTATFVLYPFPGTALLNYCRNEKIISEKKLGLIYKGAGSVHYSSMIDLPNRLLSETAAAFFPGLTSLPPSLSMFIIHIFSNKRLRWLVKIINIILLPVNNYFQFKERADNYLKMFLYRK